MKEKYSKNSQRFTGKENIVTSSPLNFTQEEKSLYKYAVLFLIIIIIVEVFNFSGMQIYNRSHFSLLFLML